MKPVSAESKRTFATAWSASAMVLICLGTSVKDGGNAEFYWWPLLALWYGATIVALVVRKAPLAWLRHHWWLQLLAPLLLLVLALLMAQMHEPFPLH